jgi:predicted DNA-binding transcriptional regulator AlpA
VPDHSSTSPTIDGYLRQRQVLGLVPFSAATLWRKSKDGTFPKPVKLSAGVTAWKASAVQQWLAERESA